MMQTGFLRCARGGFFDVQTDCGVLRCRARGRLHLDDVEPLPGDRVFFNEDPDHPGFGILNEIAPRKNSFIRPNAANLDLLVFIASGARPETDPFLIDRMSVVAEKENCGFLLCLNKVDLQSAENLMEIYRDSGFRVISTSASTGEGIEELRTCLEGSVSALTGNSGVGKSSILNLLIPGLNRQTAHISPKHGRGRHTTRHTEFFPLPGSGWVADTPGFAALELSQICRVEKSELALCFPEFPVGKCRFPNCLHRKEPDCAVQNAVASQTISSSRYRSYLRLLEDCK